MCDPKINHPPIALAWQPAQNGLDKRSAADAIQVSSLAQERFVRRLGQMKDDRMSEIAEALSLVLEI
ncbi:MAG: hypothetical protein H6Q05_2544 [Acidobacteria bacterium]|nr:hypothetical protein [Acidobacteriota bacterium]